MKYRIYIDEVGNPDLESSDNPNHRFLSLTGIIIELERSVPLIHSQMEELKGRFFFSHPDEPVIFHRKEMINARPPFGILLDRITRADFDRSLLELLQSWNYTVISVCLDKKKHKETYNVWRYDPYHYCLEILLERYVFFLEQERGKGDVMAESRGGKADMRLKASYERLWQNGTNYVSAEKIQSVLTSRQLKVKPKALNITGLQLADLVAHPSRNEILRENNLLVKPIGYFASAIISILQNKYYMGPGAVYGKKFL